MILLYSRDKTATFFQTNFEHRYVAFTVFSPTRAKVSQMEGFIASRSYGLPT